VGFDGFTDEIVQAVDLRTNPAHFKPFTRISSLAHRLAQSARKSCNIELVVKEKKIGGNAPILASALIEGGHRLALAATVGEKQVEPLFRPLTDRCSKVFLLGASGHSDAIEFNDGKVILGKMGSVQKLTAKEVIQRIGSDQLIQLLDKCRLFVSANWTMLPMMNDLWRYLIKKAVPRLSSSQRYLFVDLADPAKRTDKDLKTAIRLLRKLQGPFQVIQGLNLSEAERFAHLFHLPKRKTPEDLAQSLQRHCGFDQVVVHTKRLACAASSSGLHSQKSLYTPRPALSTGAGDNFNAGYCNALLYGMSLDEALLLGNATAGYYVRFGKSPTIPELAAFLGEHHQTSSSR
jgi:hypothetical protein